MQMQKAQNLDKATDFRYPLGVMLSLFFLFGFVTVMNDILVPHLKGLFQLDNFKSSLVQTAFFGAYFLFSLPAGALLQKTGYKKGIVISLGVVAVGLLCFLPASFLVSWPLFLAALFIIGSGITVLQVAANPYISKLGAPEGAASRLNLAGFLNSLATTIGPQLGGYFILSKENASIAEKAASVQIPYVGLAAFVLFLAFVISRLSLPEIADSEPEADNSAIQQNHKPAYAYPNLLAGLPALFLYVGAEVTIGSLLIGYLATPEMGAIPAKEAKDYVSAYWFCAMVGRLGGYFITSHFSISGSLVGAASMALILTSVAILSTGEPALYSLIAIGLSHSVMWPCIFPMAIQGLGVATRQGSALLIMMIVGGALLPPLQGWLADSFGYANSFMVLAVCYLYIGAYALKFKSL